jgi:hypothetical protein
LAGRPYVWLATKQVKQAECSAKSSCCMSCFSLAWILLVRPMLLLKYSLYLCIYFSQNGLFLLLIDRQHIRMSFGALFACG